jgi:hypothetical protein
MSPASKPRRSAPERADPLRCARAFFRAPASIQLTVLTTFLVTVWLCTNWVYQVLRKPTELLFPVSGALAKTPPQTWQEYSPIFREHATRVVTPQLLAALAQVEASGNPLVRTYWRWSWIAKPFEIYKPASSAVGMYQMTDSTFEEARHYCIRDHAVVRDSPHNVWHACPFTELYSRLVPSHAVELTSAYLDVHIASILAHHTGAHATPRQKQDLAAVIHLCGAGAGDLYAQHGFHFAEGERCGDHDPRAYLARVNAMKALFARLAAQDQDQP